MHQELAQRHGEAGVLHPGADALVHDDAKRQDLLPLAGLPAEGHLGLPHADEDAGGAELIAVVIDGPGLDGGQVGDEKAGVEGAQVDDLPGQDTEPVHEVGPPEDEPGKARHGEGHVHEAVRGVVVLLLGVAVDGGADLLRDGEDVVRRLQEDLENNIATEIDTTTNVESTIRDADMAQTATEYAKFSVLTQSGQAMLAKANQNQSGVLSLLS